MITNPCNGRLTVGKATVYVQNVNSYVESSDTPAFGLTSQRVTVKFAKFDPLIRQLLFICTGSYHSSTFSFCCFLLQPIDLISLYLADPNFVAGGQRAHY